MYINNNYGVYFAASILTSAAESGIDTYSMSFEARDISSYQSAAREIKDLGMLYSLDKSFFCLCLDLFRVV